MASGVGEVGVVVVAEVPVDDLGELSPEAALRFGEPAASRTAARTCRIPLRIVGVG
jgi:hypothetical protein